MCVSRCGAKNESLQQKQYLFKLRLKFKGFHFSFSDAFPLFATCRQSNFSIHYFTIAVSLFWRGFSVVYLHFFIFTSMCLFHETTQQKLFLFKNEQVRYGHWITCFREYIHSNIIIFFLPNFQIWTWKEMSKDCVVNFFFIKIPKHKYWNIYSSENSGRFSSHTKLLMK